MNKIGKVHKRNIHNRIFIAFSDPKRTDAALFAVHASLQELEPEACRDLQSLKSILEQYEECTIVLDEPVLTQVQEKCTASDAVNLVLFPAPENLSAARIAADRHNISMVAGAATAMDFAPLTGYLAGFMAAAAKTRGQVDRAVRRYEDLVHALPDIVYELNPDGIITFINDSVSIIGYKPNDLIGKHYSVLLHEDELPLVDRDLVLAEYAGHQTGIALSPKLFNERRCIERRTSELEVKLRRNPAAPGLLQDLIVEVTSYGEVSAAGEYTRDGERQFLGSVGIIRDMSLRRKSEEMLRKLYQAVDQLSSGVFVVNRSFEIEYVNPSFFYLTAFSPEEVIGKSIFHFFNLLPETVETSCVRIQSGLEIRHEVLANKALGGQYWAELSMAPIRSPNGVITHAIATVEDISARKHMQELLKAAKDQAEGANQAKSRFLASMTHELKSPIAGILAASRLMQLSKDDYSKRIESILANAQALLDIMNGILDYVRSDNGESSIQNLSFPFKPFMESILKPFHAKAAKKGLSLACEIRSMDVIQGDPDRLGRAIGILVDNAVKFTENGIIKVYANLETKADNSACIQVSVKDTGVGIGSTDKDRIFQPFTQLGTLRGSAARGAGIGLALARNIIASMGGEIKVESNPGIGSIFSLTVPTRIPEPLDITIPVPYSILLVDENEINLEYLRDLMQKTGLRVLAASSGAEALRLLEEKYIDAAVMDAVMSGSSGVQLAKNIRNYSGSRNSGSMPLFALASRHTEEVKAADSLFDRTFIKPTDARLLSASLVEFIAARDRAHIKPSENDRKTEPKRREQTLAQLTNLSHSALDALISATAERGTKPIDIKTETDRLGSVFQYLENLQGIEYVRLFAEHYTSEELPVLQGLLSRIEAMIHQSFAPNKDDAAAQEK
jgi:PAS domain S-box-containing protein